MASGGIRLILLLGLIQGYQTLDIPALGRFARIGELYDGVANNFTGLMVFRKALPPQLGLVQLHDNPFTETAYTVYDSLQQKINFMGLNAELAIEVKTGGVEFSATGKAAFIHSEKSSRKYVEGVFSHKTMTKKESVQLTDEDVKPYVSTTMLANPNATHVVTGIYYGGDVYIKFMDTNSLNEDTQKIAGSLELTLKLAQISGRARGEVETNSTEIYQTFNYTLQVFGDVAIHMIPGCAAEIQNLTRDIPQELSKVNGGKGKPVTYVLTPLAEIRESFKLEEQNDKMVYSLDEEKLNQILVTLDDISKVRQMLNDLLGDFDVHREIVPPAERKRLRELMSDFEYAALDFQASVRKALVDVRTAGNQDLLTQVYGNYLRSNVSADNVRSMLDYDFDAIERKIPFYNNFLANKIEYLGKSNSLGPYLIKAQSSIVYIVYFSIHLMENDMGIWEENRELLGYIKQPWSSIAALDCDFWPARCANMTHTVIHGYFKGRLGTQDARVTMPASDESYKLLPGLGRSNKIGDLYDAASGEFLDQSIFFTATSTDKVQPEPLKTLGYCKSTTSTGWEGILSQLKAPSELGYLLYRNGLMLPGSGEAFLPDNLPLDNSTANLVCLNRTRQEFLNITADDVLFNLLDLATITGSGATHFVEKVEYGAISIISFFNESLAQAQKDAARWLSLAERHLIHADGPKGDFPGNTVSSMKLFSDISPRYVHQLAGEELEEFLENVPKYMSQLNGGKGTPVAYTLRPISVLKKNFAVASESNRVSAEDEDLKTEMVSQCGKLRTPRDCIGRRFAIYDEAKSKKVNYVWNEDSFAKAFRDTSEKELFFLYFRYEWIDAEVEDWVRNSQKFYDLITGHKFLVDCNFFENGTRSICGNVTKPQIHKYVHGELVSNDYEKELPITSLAIGDEFPETGTCDDYVEDQLKRTFLLLEKVDNRSMRIQTELANIHQKSPPVGFIYVQNREQSRPEQLWPGTQWQTKPLAQFAPAQVFLRIQ